MQRLRKSIIIANNFLNQLIIYANWLIRFIRLFINWKLSTGYPKKYDAFTKAVDVLAVSSCSVEFEVQDNDSGYETIFYFGQLADPTDYLIEVEEGLIRMKQDTEEMHARAAKSRDLRDIEEYKRLKKKFKGTDIE